MKKIVFISVFTLFVKMGFTQDIVKTTELVTDRPDQTEAAILVPPGAIQVETGFMIESSSPGKGTLKDYTYNTTLFRYGLNENFEFRFLQEILGSKYGDNLGSSSSTSGLSPMSLGVKIKVAKADKLIPEIAFISHITFPTGSKDFNSTYISSDFRFSMEYDLSDKFSLGINLGAERDGETARITGIYTFVLGYSPADKFGFYIEGYGFITEKTSPPHDHRFNGGFTYMISDLFQFDISGGIGLTENSMDYFISTGLSFRLFK